MKLRIDFHVHTNASKDGLDDARSILNAARKKGLDGIAITDHNTMESIDDAVKMGKRMGVVIIRGEEVRTKSGDVLVFGLKKPIPKGLSLKRSIELAKKQCALVFAAHPYAKLFHILSSMGDEARKHEFDGIEAFNSRTYMENWKGIKLALEKGICMIAGSDAHSAVEVGTAYTVVYANGKSEAEVLHALKKNRVKLQMRRTPPHLIARWYLKRVISFS